MLYIKPHESWTQTGEDDKNYCLLWIKNMIVEHLLCCSWDWFTPLRPPPTLFSLDSFLYSLCLSSLFVTRRVCVGIPATANTVFWLFFFCAVYYCFSQLHVNFMMRISSCTIMYNRWEWPPYPKSVSNICLYYCTVYMSLEIFTSVSVRVYCRSV